MAATTETVESEQLRQRVEERITKLPAVHMTAMQTMAGFMWLPLAIMGVMILGSGAIIAGVNSFRVDEFFGFNVPGAREALDELVKSGIGRWVYAEPGPSGGRPAARFELVCDASPSPEPSLETPCVAFR